MSAAEENSYRTSSYSGNGANCVEVAVSPQVVGVRDSKARQEGALLFGGRAWSRFLDTLKSGRHE